MKWASSILLGGLLTLAPMGAADDLPGIADNLWNAFAWHRPPEPPPPDGDPDALFENADDYVEQVLLAAGIHAQVAEVPSPFPDLPDASPEPAGPAAPLPPPSAATAAHDAPSPPAPVDAREAILDAFMAAAEPVAQAPPPTLPEPPQATAQTAASEPLLAPAAPAVADPLPTAPEPAPAAAAPSPAPAAHGATYAIGLGAAVGGLALVARIIGLWPLLTRIPRERVRDHPLRSRILEEVERRPGIHLNDLGRRLGLSNSQRSHHVRALVEAGLLLQHEAGGYMCLFTAGHPTVALAALAPYLRTPRARRVLVFLVERPAQTRHAACRGLGMPSGTLHYHLRRLRAAGLVCAEGRGRNCTFSATVEGRRVARELADAGVACAPGAAAPDAMAGAGLA